MPFSDTLSGSAVLPDTHHRTLPGTYFSSGGSCGGWGVGAALGAKLALPDRQVVHTSGDGYFMFGTPPEGTIIQVDTFAKLKNAKTKVLDNENLDVFGDGTVVIMSAPGHTPGHQVLAVKLAHRGLVVLAGDLYHYPEERTTGRTPTFEFNAEQSRASRAKIEQFVKDNHAELWIEHDIATHASLPRSPKYVD